MLFRYPFQNGASSKNDASYYARPTEDVLYQNPYQLKDNKTSDTGNNNNPMFFDVYSDSEMASLMAPKSVMCDQKFELKIGQVKFIGYPVQVRTDGTCSGFQDLLELDEKEGAEGGDGGSHDMIDTLNVVFAIHAKVEVAVTIHYQNLCLMLGKALRHEEKRVRYLSREHEMIVSEIDEIEELPESEQNVHQRTLARSQLAKDIVQIFDDICSHGVVNISVNGWLGLNYCFPHKIHKLDRDIMIDTEKFHWYVRRIKPYHTLLLVDAVKESEKDNLIKSLPFDASPVLLRLIKSSSSVKNFQTLCLDADISLSQIFRIVAHLMYWGKCIVIYPLAENNVYVVAESAPTEMSSRHAEEFGRKFPKHSLHQVLQKFSFPLTLGDYRSPLMNDRSTERQIEHTHIVHWLLRNRFIKQLHTFIYMVPMYAKDLLKDDGGVDSNNSIKDFPQRHHLRNSEKRIFDSFSREEQLSLVKICSYHVEREDIVFFLNLSKYFRGKHHLENIMYYENVPRSRLLIIIDKFRSILVTVQHEDAATVQMVERSIVSSQVP